MRVVDELRELEAAATPGPWQLDGDAYSHGIRGRPPEGDIVASWDNRRSDRDAPNVALIAAMRNALPGVLIALEALERIADMPTSERNPDGDEQAAHSMQLVAQEALAALESAQGAERQK